MLKLYDDGQFNILKLQIANLTPDGCMIYLSFTFFQNHVNALRNHVTNGYLSPDAVLPPLLQSLTRDIASSIFCGTYFRLLCSQYFVSNFALPDYLVIWSLIKIFREIVCNVDALIPYVSATNSHI